MRRNGIIAVIVFSLLCPLMTISCDTADEPEAAAVIGPEGGKVEVTDPTSRIFGTKVVIPEGALESNRLITISELTVGDSDPNANSIVEIGPEGLNLIIAANVTVPYREEDPNGILDESTNTIFKVSQMGEVWEIIPTTSLDTEENLVTGMVQSFSSFTVSNDEVRHETPEFIGTGYPLILVHGVTTALESPKGDCDSTFGSLKAYLADLGFDVWTFNYNTARWIEICAGNLGMAIEGILDRKEDSGYSAGGHISVICHSMGGLVTRAYIQRYALKWGNWKWTFPFRETERVSYRGEIDSIIMTGVPNHGSVWGAINYGFAIGPEIEKIFDQIRFSSVEMIPGSDFLDNLNDTSRALFELPESIDYRNIHGHYFNDAITGEENDGIVLRSSSELSEWKALEGYDIQDYTVEAAHIRLDLPAPLNWNPGIAYIDNEDHVTWEVIHSILLSWDPDGDGVPSFTDNCPTTYNPDQADSDDDGTGDACELEYDSTVDGGWWHTVGLKSNGAVVAVGDNFFGQCEVNEWTNIIQVTAGADHTVAVKSDGTVVATGYYYQGQCDVGNWTDIIQVAAGCCHTVGLKSDGTVVAVGSNQAGQCGVDEWKDIIQIAAGYYHTVGLKSDGTVVALGYNSLGECNVGNWTDITQISASNANTVGLKSDGTVVIVGDNTYWQCDVGGWTNIAQIANGMHTVGLKSDGTVVAVGGHLNDAGQCDVGDWVDIIEVAAGTHHTIGVKSDGTVVATGMNGDGQCDVEGWDLN